MGLFTIRNRKHYGRKSGRKKKSYLPKVRTEKKKQKRNVSNQVLVEDEELMSYQQVKKKIKHRNSSITVSGKRRQKMLKRLRHTAREGEKIDRDLHQDVEMVEEPKKKKKSKKRKSEGMDTD